MFEIARYDGRQRLRGSLYLSIAMSLLAAVVVWIYPSFSGSFDDVDEEFLQAYPEGVIQLFDIRTMASLELISRRETPSLRRPVSVTHVYRHQLYSQNTCYCIILIFHGLTTHTPYGCNYLDDVLSIWMRLCSFIERGFNSQLYRDR